MKKNKIKIIIALLILFMIMSIIIPLIIKRKTNSVETITANIKNAKASNSVSDYKGTIINIPIDSRPISTNNFEYLTGVAGYNYVEVGTNYLDSMGSDEIWKTGNPSSVRNSVKSKFASGSYNTSDTTVIINTTSYFFGGLIATSDYEAYEDMETKVNDLKTLISTYNAPYIM